MEKCPSVGEQISRLDRREQFASPGRFWILFPSRLGSVDFDWTSGVGNCCGLRRLVALIQRLVVFCSGVFTTRGGQGRKNVRVVRREKL